MHKKTSIDQTELNKFNKNHQEWWDKSGEFKILHEINPIRLNYIVEQITKHFNLINFKEQPLNSLNILDIGSGGGLITIPISAMGAKVTGIDANDNNIKAASEYAKADQLKVDFVCSTIEDYLRQKNNNNFFDVVLCLEVIEHVANPKEFIENLTKLVKSNGIIILSTINRNIKSYLHTIIAAEYILKWVKIGTHDYKKFIKPSEINNMLSNTGFVIKKLSGLNFNILENKWYISDDISVNYFASIVLPED